MVPGAVNAEPVGVNRDHAGLAKYESADDGEFHILVENLARMVKTAPAENKKVWDTYRRTLGKRRLAIPQYTI